MAFKYSNLGINAVGGAPKIDPNATPENQYIDAQNAANAANQQRYQQGLGLWDKIVGAYAPGGSFGQGAMASYQQGMNKALSSSAQSLVGSGLYNSTTTAGLAPRYEQEVGTPFRLNLADEQTRGYTSGLQGAAGFVERRTDQAPDPNTFANLMKQGGTTTRYGNVPSFGMGGGGYTPGYMPQDSGYWQGSAVGKDTTVTGMPGTGFQPQMGQQLTQPSVGAGQTGNLGDYTPSQNNVNWDPDWGDPVKPTDKYYEDLMNQTP